MHKPEFRAATCEVVRIGEGPKGDIYLSNKQLEEKNKYKYHGEIINNKGNIKDHIDELRGKRPAAVQKILIETAKCELHVYGN